MERKYHYTKTMQILLPKGLAARSTFPPSSSLEEREMNKEEIGSGRAEELTAAITAPMHYNAEKGLYFVGRKPGCQVIGLCRDNQTRTHEFSITAVERLEQVSQSIQEHHPYTLFLIDAPSQDAFSCVETIIRGIDINHSYFNHRPLISVVENGIKGIVSELASHYTQTPLRFIPAKRYGADVIDAQLFGQLRY